MGKTKMVAADDLGDLISRYQRDRKVTAVRMAAELGLKRPECYWNKVYRGVGGFTLDEFRTCCRVLSIPTEDAAKVFCRYLQE